MVSPRAANSPHHAMLSAICALLLSAPVSHAFQAGTTVTLKPPTEPSVLGQPATFVAAVSPAAATGSVAFSDGITVLGASKLTAGQASFTTRLLAAGKHVVTARYTGDRSNPASVSAPATHIVQSVGGDGFLELRYTSIAFAGTCVTADFNGDGRPDLAVSAGSQVSILLGVGDGTFGKPIAYGTPRASGARPDLVTADFNGDGFADFALASSQGLAVRLGFGDGTFRPVPNIFPIEQLGNYSSLAVADFNRDGIPDLVVISSSSAQAAILFGTGDGNFRPSGWTSTIASAGQAVTTGDFNGDGLADFAVTSYPGAVQWFRALRDGSFDGPIIINWTAGGVSILAADLNSDGLDDLIVSGFSPSGLNPLRVIMRASAVAFSEPVPLLNGDSRFQTSIKQVFFGSAVADVNGDGFIDIIAPGGQGLAVLLGNNDGTFRPAVTQGVVSANRIVPGDFNGDGRTDLMVIEEKNGVVPHLGTRTAPDLSATITRTTVPAEGQSFAYTLSVANLGESATKGAVKLTATLSPGLTATSFQGTGWSCTLSPLSCTRSDALDPHSKFPALALTVLVSAQTASAVTAKVTVSGGAEVDVLNNSASDTAFVVQPVPQLAVPESHVINASSPCAYPELYCRQNIFPMVSTSLGIAFRVRNLPAASQFHVQFRRPNGSVANDFNVSPNNAFAADAAYVYRWTVNLNMPGDWQQVLEINGTPAATLTFSVHSDLVVPQAEVINGNIGNDAACGYPILACRQSTFAPGANPIGLFFRAFNLPPDSTFKLRFLRPDGSPAREAIITPKNSASVEAAYWYVYPVNLDTPGLWTLTLDINDTPLASRPFTVSAPAGPAITAVVNAASGQSGGIAPNEFVTIVGKGLGPQSGVSGNLETTLAGTKVFVGGVLAPLAYAQDGQVNAVLPWTLPSGSTNIQVEYNGTLGNSFSIPVVTAAPGIFTQQYGPGQAWGVNQDGTMNSDSNPAPKGSYVAFWLTGQGPVDLPQQDGQQPTGPPFPAPRAAVSVRLGALNLAPENIVFKGLIYSGVLQMNLFIPNTAPTGPSVPLSVTIGPAASRSDVTIAIR